MNRILRWCAWCAWVVAVPAWAAPQKVELLGQYIRSSQAVYPLVVGDWLAGDEHRFDNAALGASIRYRREGAGWSDVYLYPAGPLTPEALEQAARAELAQIEAAAGKSGSWETVNVAPLQRIEMAGEPDAKGKRTTEVAWGSVMQLQVKGRELHSVMLLALRNMYFVKLRYSVPAEQDPGQTLATARGLFEPLMQRLRISNRGDCYDPIPLVAVDAPLDAKMPGAVAAVENDGKVLAVATAERVLARDVKAPEAAVLQFVASSHTGRIGPGCEAPDMEPRVPEGMRELRFEYPDASVVPSVAPSSGDGVVVSQG